ncbi:REJ domain protein (macronuclear) [Tetrahymena thermophila SB210]|uniref:REJ domain protein n=1 Tax=Tetrahymena thermophila (strain SB210) TaxID=312017 RepID=Q23JT8_TETTS|nr:REJ domain protein [Tetrahymena thermophila SB210]EAR96772.2 REJ domain protein [Tetrahymena thermophila SB210]|eukprot:XP_001017017.2 REJ domain protein [Tetrahymena thermophila SB210]
MMLIYFFTLLWVTLAQDCSLLLSLPKPANTQGYECLISTSTTFDDTYLQNNWRFQSATINHQISSAQTLVRQPCANLIQPTKQVKNSIGIAIDKTVSAQYLTAIYISYDVYFQQIPAYFYFEASWFGSYYYNVNYTSSNFTLSNIQQDSCSPSYYYKSFFENITYIPKFPKSVSTSFLLALYSSYNTYMMNSISNCPVGCANTCTTTGQCSVCSSGYNPVGNKCVIQCQPSQYRVYDSVSTKQTCLPCMANCNSCSDNITCSSCATGYTYAFVKGQNQCYPSCKQPAQYIDPNGVCQNCIQNCSQCSQANTCDVCQQNYMKTMQNTCLCQGYVSNNQCLSCYDYCQTCTDGQNTSCLSCISNYYPVMNSQNQLQFECLQICPNNYQLINNTCQLCNQIIYNSCFNCPNTCRSCSFSSLQNNQCLDCNDGMQMDPSTKLCQCKLDPRNLDFYYCSFNKIAVVQATFSSTTPTLTLEFGINLVSQADLKCSQIFAASTLSLLGSSSCSISSSQVIVYLSQDAQIMVNDTISLTTSSQVLLFQKAPLPIDTIYLISVVQESIPHQVNVKYSQIINSCNDITFQIQKLQNDAGRGFLFLEWKLAQPQSFDQQTLQNLNSILQNANAQKNYTLVIPKYVVPANTNITIQLYYMLKVYSTDTLSFTTFNQKGKQIAVNSIQNQYPPLYRYLDLIIQFQFNSFECDQTGLQLSQDIYDIEITSQSLPSLNNNWMKFNQQVLKFEIQPYSVPFNSSLDIQLFIYLDSNKNVNTTYQLSIPYKISNLQTMILNGAKMLADYKSDITISGSVRDLEVQDPKSPQGINLSWYCYSIGSDMGDNQCYTYLKSVYDVPQNVLSFNISSGTFNPYQVLQFTLSGSKDKRITNATLLIILAEINLPPLLVQFDDPSQIDQVNINEDISATLVYGSNVPSDILTYAGAILYNNQVVGVIKFDFYKVKFRIWDYFSNINIANPVVQVRFTVYNPANIMPSLSVTNFNINIPPQNCVLSISPQSGFTLTTKFVIQFTGCSSPNNPLTYQFFYYNQNSDLKQEIQIPQNILRRQFQDQNTINQVTTYLPSGNIVILGQAMDSYLAVYNTTLQVSVSPFQGSEQNLLDLLDESLSEQNTDLQTSQIIKNLCVIGEELAKNNTLYYLDSISQRKLLLISAIIKMTNLLPSSSFLSTFSNKIIANLQLSLSSQYQQQNQNILNQVNLVLQKQKQLIATNNLNNKLQNNNDIILQNLVDSFKILNSTTLTISQTLQQISNNNGNRLLSMQDEITYKNTIESLRALASSFPQDILQQQMNISDQIGNLLNNITLPNQGPLQLEGNLISINTEQITAKNLQNYYYMQNKPLKNDSSIYNVVITNYSSNPFIKTPGFQSYIAQIENSTPGIQISLNSVVKPLVQSIDNTPSPNLNNSLELQFSNIKQSKYNLTCLQQQSDQSWLQSQCYLINSTEIGSYTCICKDQRPTTVTEDLRELLINKNLQTAFGSQGIKNISNFTTFYEYAVFWVLSSVTLIQIGLCIFGYLLDQKNQFSSIISGSMSTVSPISLANIIKTEQNITDEQQQLKMNQLKQQSLQFQQTNSIQDQFQPKSQSQRGIQSNINLKRPEQNFQGESKLIIQQNQEIYFERNNDKQQNFQGENDNQSIQSIYLNQQDQKEVQKIDQSDEILQKNKDKQINTSNTNQRIKEYTKASSSLNMEKNPHFSLIQQHLLRT